MRRIAMLYLIHYSYEKDGLTYWFYNSETHEIVKKTKLQIERELNLPEHNPYLLTLDNELPKIEGVLNVKNIVKYNAIEDKYITYKKVEVTHPSIVYDKRTKSGLRTKLKTSWEDKILYADCFVYDSRELVYGFKYPAELRKFNFERNNREKILQFYRYLMQLPIPIIKRVALDIEVYNEESDKIPNPRVADKPIIACSFVSDYFRKVVILKYKGIKVIAQNGSEIEHYVYEKALINRIFEIIKRYPFIITFNGDNFDLQYIYYRAKRLGFKDEDIPIIVEHHGNQTKCDLKNAIHIDMCKLFKNNLLRNGFKELKNVTEFTLENMARVFLKEEHKLTKPDFSNCTDKELKEYCLKDSIITYKLSRIDNDKPIRLLFLVSRLANTQITNTYRKSVGSIIRYVLHFMHRLYNYLIINPEDLNEKRKLKIVKPKVKGKKYKGAITLKPERGVHFKVYVIDVASLYPSAIEQFNLSYETIACPHEECKHNIAPEHDFHICTKNIGILSLIVSALKTLRVKEYKPKAKDKTLDEETRKWYDCLQAVTKLLINATYGVFGDDDLEDLYFVQLASVIASCSRYCMKKLIEKAKKYRARVIYGDTDSAFIKTEDINVVYRIIEEIKQELGIDVEFDKEFRLCILHKKKNYVGITPDNKIDVKGLVGQKRHMCNFHKKVFKQILETLKEIYSKKDILKVKLKLKEIINNALVDLKLKRVELSDLNFKIKLKYEPQKGQGQDYEVARYYLRMGVEKHAGDFINKVLIKKKNGLTAKPLEFTSKDEIDIEKYVEHLFSILEQVLSPLGITKKMFSIESRVNLDDYLLKYNLKMKFQTLT
ncbi:hypothetical protein DRN69_07650 [Candidatus Pacearchaeota archaeon]|nr:MAG: hypothetical protein DRN69_07650 [Candidatus Pacearchaeota archaeon]